MTKIMIYHRTHFRCLTKKHRRPIIYNSPEEIREVAHALICPLCGNFGLEVIKQEPEITHTMSVS